MYPQGAFRAFGVLEKLPLIVGCAIMLAACKGSPNQDLPLVEDFNIQKAIFQAIASGGGTLELSRGKYILERPLYIDRAEDLVIEGNGALLMFAFAADPDLPQTFAMTIQNSKNVTLRDLTIDFDPLPFTQGEIMDLDPKGEWVDVQIHKGYREDEAFFLHDVRLGDLSLHLFDPTTGQLKVGSSFLFPTDITSLSEGMFRFSFADNPDAENHHHMEIGDYVATAAWRAMPFAIRNSEGTRLENVTIWAAGGAAISEVGGGGGTDLQINLVPGPRAEDAKVDRLWSASRDGYHGCCMRRGPVIHDSQFVSLGDDAINVFTVVFRILEVDSENRRVKVTSLDGRKPTLQPGDEVIVYNPTNVAQKAHSRVVGASPGGDVWELEAVVGIEVDDLVFCPDVGGKGTVVRDSVFRNMDAGGITVKAHDAVIENNLLEHIAISGIELGVYLNYYFEGPYAANTVIRNNTLKDAGFSAFVTDGVWRLNGAITMGLAQISDLSMLESNREFRNITIENNTIEGTANVGLFIGNASGVTVRGNRVAKTNQMPTPPGGGNWWGVPNSSAIMVFESEDVQFQDTVVSNVGQFGVGAITVHSSADAESIDTSGLKEE